MKYYHILFFSMSMIFSAPLAFAAQDWRSCLPLVQQTAGEPVSSQISFLINEANLPSSAEILKIIEQLSRVGFRITTETWVSAEKNPDGSFKKNPSGGLIEITQYQLNVWPLSWQVTEHSTESIVAVLSEIESYSYIERADCQILE